MNAKLIINADDFGIHPEINKGILDSFKNGALTSTTLLVTTPYLAESVDALKVLNQSLPTGLHISLTLGTAIAPVSDVTALVNEDGRFKLSAKHLMFVRPGNSSGALFEQIEIEIGAQIRKALELGVAIDHIDSHQHVHMNPCLYGIFERQAKLHGIDTIRFCREKFISALAFRNIGKNLVRQNPVKWALIKRFQKRIKPQLTSTDFFFGLMHSGNIDENVMLGVLRFIPAGKSMEIGIHPGVPLGAENSAYPEKNVDLFIQSKERDVERRVLISPRVLDEINKLGITLVSFGDL